MTAGQGREKGLQYSGIMKFFIKGMLMTRSFNSQQQLNTKSNMQDMSQEFNNGIYLMISYRWKLDGDHKEHVCGKEITSGCHIWWHSGY